MTKKKVKVLKPVENNGNADSPLQFEVNKDIKKSKKIKPKEVFDVKGRPIIKKPRKPRPLK
jgi:hypothetical protein